MSHYPIRAISELTGVSATTLRAWERRYGLLKPARTPKGHRLYSSEDIELIKEIVELLKHEHSISEAVKIVRNPELRSAQMAAAESHWVDYQQSLLRAIENFNLSNLDRTYNDALAIYPVDMVTEQVIMPVLKTLGERWQKRQAGIAEEHFFSAFLRNKLGARLHHESQRSGGKRILVSCLPGEYHELGILLFCIAAMGRGYQLLYLGSNLPPQQLALVAARTDVAAVLISGTRVDAWSESLQDELKTTMQSLSVPLMFGGEFSTTFETRIEQLGACTLGAEHSSALDKMESVVPAFDRK